MSRSLDYLIKAPTSRRWWVIPVGYMLFLQFLTGIPKPDFLLDLDGPETLWELSKIIYDYPYYLQDLSHLPLFAGLAWLWSWYLGGPAEGKRICGKALVISLTYGVFNEFIQAFIPSRFPSTGDLMMNVAGVFCGVWLHGLIVQRSKDRAE